VALWLGGRFGTSFALYQSLEFTGPGAAAMSLEGRFTLAAHAVELGAKFGLFDYDDKAEAFLAQRPGFERLRAEMRPVSADADAAYEQEVAVDLAALPPQVARPHTFENVVPVGEVRGVRVSQAQIGSCANGHIEDIALLARALAGRKVHPGTRLFVQPSSWGVYRAAMEQGHFASILDAGGQVLSPGCHLCLGMQGALAPGDVCISSTTRNFRGRMGSGEAEIYLASPVTVAAAAVAGEIVDPREVVS
jgi:3-isopropylmalate/(R)-2-methylmalate dehydratase large subunit